MVESKWLEFIDESIEGRKTKRIKVRNKVLNQDLGYIRWEGGWRQYVFDDGRLILALSCMGDLSAKIKELKEERVKNNAKS